MSNIENGAARFLANKDAMRRLMQMDSNGSMNKIAHDARTSGKIDISEGVETTYTPQSYETTTPQNQAMPQIPKQVMNTQSKLPKEILESFQNKQIDTSVLGLGTTGSVLDRIDFNTNGQLFSKEPQVKQVVAEASKPIVTEQLAPQVNTSVDYSMIKMIVEECVRKYTSALKKSILSEAKQTQNSDTLKALKIGDKFTFVTNDGDLYEAKLTFVKNINKK